MLIGKFQGKTVIVTGAGKGQGRSHVIAFAREGADLVISDLYRDDKQCPYHLGTQAELEETAKVVRESGCVFRTKSTGMNALNYRLYAFLIGSLFAEDAEVDAGPLGTYKGIDQLKKFYFEMVPAALPMSLHFLHNQIITLRCHNKWHK